MQVPPCPVMRLPSLYKTAKSLHLVPSTALQLIRVFMVVRSSASCTARNSDGKTPLEVAQLNTQSKVIELLEKQQYI